MASVLGTLWVWIVWIVVGGLAGALTDGLIQGDTLSILGTLVVGIVGGVIGSSGSKPMAYAEPYILTREEGQPIWFLVTLCFSLSLPRPSKAKRM